MYERAWSNSAPVQFAMRREEAHSAGESVFVTQSSQPHDKYQFLGASMCEEAHLRCCNGGLKAVNHSVVMSTPSLAQEWAVSKVRIQHTMYPMPFQRAAQ